MLPQTNEKVLYIISIIVLLLGLTFLTACELSDQALAGEASRIQVSRCNKNKECREARASCVQVDGCSKLRGAARRLCLNRCFDQAVAVGSGCIASGAEVCDGRDNDCNGKIDDGIRSPEVCDNKDNDCNGKVDDRLPPQSCNTGLAGVCSNGLRTCQAGSLSACVQSVQPSAEVCNSLDDDCDGQVDNGFADLPEVCDAVDNNCNNLVDETFDFQSDVNNCGQCGTACPPSFVCRAGICSGPEPAREPTVALYMGGSGMPTGTLLKSNDGGQSWIPLNFNGVPVIGDTRLFCRDAQTCFAVQETGRIFKITNGQVVEPVYNHRHGSIHDLSCSDRQHCVAVGNKEYLFTTSTGGDTWQVTGGGSSDQLVSVSCNSLQQCIALKRTASSPPQSFAVPISNGLVGNPLEIKISGTVQSISCTTESCLAVGNKIVKISWAQPDLVTTINSYTPTYALDSVYCVDPLVCFAVGRVGLIIKTTDGGSSWEQQNSGTSKFLNSVSCSNSEECWVVGENGVMLKTTTGGARWEPVAGAPSGYLLSIVAVQE